MSANFLASPDDQLLMWSANVLLQVTLITAVGLSVAALLRRQPAARYWVLSAALILMLLCPVVVLVVQSSGNSFLSLSLASQSAAQPVEPPAARPPAAQPAVKTSRRIASRPAGTLNQESAVPVEAALAPPAKTDVPDKQLALTNGREPAVASADPVAHAIEGAATSVVTTDVAAASSSGRSWLRSVVNGLVILWASGVIFYLVRLGWGWLQLQRILRSTAPNENEQLAATFEQVLREMSVRRIPELLRSNRIAGPVATGVFRPRVIIPEGIVEQVTAAELRNILIHETAHIVRRDQIVVWLQNVAAALFWPHPLAAAVNQRLARAREEICDNYVLVSTDPCSYSRTLLSLATVIHASRPLPGTVGLFTSRWKLERRVAELLDERRNCRTGLTRYGTALVAGLAIAMAVVAACGTITLADGPSPSETPSANSSIDAAPQESNDAAQPAGSAKTDANVAQSPGEWRPGNRETALPGLIPAPANVPGLGRWQAMMLPVGGYVEAAVFRPDGKSIAFGEGTYVRIHDAESLELQQVLVGHSGNVRAVGWSPDGKWIVSGADDATVRIWSKDGVAGPVLTDHLAPVREIAWSPDSRAFASAALDGTIRIWNLDGTSQTVIDGHEAPVNTIAWSPDGKVLAAGDQNRLVRFWGSDGKPGPVLSGHHGAITRVRWSPDGNWLASTSEGLVPTEPGQQPVATVRLWKADGTAGPTLHGHTRSIRAVAWSPDSRQLITTGEDRQVILWDANTTNSRRLEQTGFDYGDVFSLDWNASAGRILAGGRFSVRFFTADGPAGSRDLIRYSGSKLMFADWHPRENKIAIAGADGTIHIWSDGFKNERTIDGFASFVGCVKWSPDGRKLAVDDLDQTVHLFDPDGEPIKEFSGNGGIPRGMAWSPDGSLLVVNRRSAMTDIFNLNSEGDVQSATIHAGGATGAAFSPDGTQLATSGLDANVMVTQIDSSGKTTKRTALMQAFDGDVDSIDWSPDGQWIATGHNTSLRFWRADGTPGAVVPGFDASVMRVDWSPDSKTVVTGGWDSTVLLWNIDGTLVREFPNHAAPCWGVTFSPDGKKLATCGWDGVARILDVQTGDILEMAIYVAGFEPPAEGSQVQRQTAIAFNRAGQVTSGDLDVLEQRVVYLVEQPSGACEILKPSEFFAKAGGAVLAKSP